jgi:hypothetical protein
MAQVTRKEIGYIYTVATLMFLWIWLHKNSSFVIGTMTWSFLIKKFNAFDQI